MFSKEKVSDILFANGFEIKNQSNIGDSYTFDLGNEWQVSVFCPFVGNVFEGNVDKLNYEALSASLFDSIGTKFKFKNVASLEANIKKVLRILKENSDDDDILKCEKCGVRYMQPKEPTFGKKWKPFLSCSGMIIKGTGKNKGILCDGTSKKLPAVVLL
ncbi:hypothetical protein I5504_01355 [Citrobacter koseri]|uniref:hypothetical protein n=1 Tax=Citrobacter koseri TaxID=545 RepID=UPI0018FFB216|nr:hypothetical protein [Citrobacter koseri]MBJ9304727.1 hypothetical protein [Citrobacter koseri]MBJ9366220.1 hypothetical protein [Citrobacter koseri]